MSRRRKTGGRRSRTPFEASVKWVGLHPRARVDSDQTARRAFRCGNEIPFSQVRCSLEDPTEETKVAIVPPPPPEAPPKRVSRWAPEPYSRPQEPTKVFQPNGKLIFHHEGRVYRHASNLADGKRCPLEDRLHEIVNAILDDAEQARLAEIESQHREAEAAIERKRREEEERLRRIEEARRFDLWSQVEDFRFAVPL